MKKITSSLLILSTTILTSACSIVTTNLTKTGDKEYPPLSEDCPVTIYTSHPQKEYYEIGVVDLDVALWGFTRPNISKANKVKDRVSDEVCELGGNGIFLWEADGGGYYRKVTIVRTM